MEGLGFHCKACYVPTLLSEGVSVESDPGDYWVAKGPEIDCFQACEWEKRARICGEVEN